MASPIDHEARATGLLTRQYKRPNLEALLAALAGALQETDDVAVELPEDALGLDTAIGVQLEQLAELVGAPVLGGEDETRALAKTRIRRNRSRGTLNDSIAVLELFPVVDFDISEKFPARIEIQAYEVPVKLGPALAEVISGTRAAAVGTGIVASSETRANTFRYSSTGATVPASSSGYGNGKYGYGYET